MTFASIISRLENTYIFRQILSQNPTVAKMASDLANNALESPRKRQRLSPSTDSGANIAPQPQSRNIPMMDANKLVADSTGFQLERESQVGILHFVSSTNSGFSGILKQRYVYISHNVGEVLS